MRNFLVLAFVALLISGDNSNLQDVSKMDQSKLCTIKGKILLDGLALKPKEITPNDKCKDCKDAYDKGDKLYTENMAVNKDGTLQNVLVSIKTGLENYTFPPTGTKRTLDQKLCRYIPHVIALTAGETLHILNSDDCEHNVNGEPKKRDKFNMPQSRKGQEDKVVFDKAEPEPIIVKCQIHDWMQAWVHVLPHPKFSVTSETGTYEISGVPAGKYKIETWHEELGKQTKEIELKEGSTETLDFTYSQPSGTIKGTVKVDGNPRSNVIVSIKKGLEKYNILPLTSPRVLEISSGKFNPGVLALISGETLELKNSDSNKYDVDCKNDALKTSLDSGKSVTKTFYKPEAKPFEVKAKDQKAWVYILPRTKFMITGNDGTFEFKLPAGRYTVEAWHECAPDKPQTKANVVVKANQDAKVELTFKK